MTKITKYKFTFLAILLNLLIILFVYWSVFSLEFQGDTWHYAWGHHVYYSSNVFGELSVAGMRSSLAGASLTFGLIENNFGLNALVFYTISVILKFLSVIAFYFLVKKLTINPLVSLLASLSLAVSFTGVEATHWVFNMYAYIGLILITLSLYLALDLPENFQFRKFLPALFFACLGVWYATMRTSGIIPLILIFSSYKALSLRTLSSYKNLIAWIIGFVIFLPIDKFLLGQMESDYSQKHIIEEGIRAIGNQIAISKFDFLTFNVGNVGAIMLPDITWTNLNFPKVFSFLGPSSLHNAFLPSFLIYLLFSKLLKKIWFSGMTFYGLIWTIVVLFISRMGPNNYTNWVNIVMTLFGGYFLITSLNLFFSKVPQNLKDLFLLSFLWSFLFLLLPGFQNGGPIYATYHRYMATTAPSVPLIMAGLLTLSFSYKNKFFRSTIFLIVLFMIFSHGMETQKFFDHKAELHNQELADRIWQEFTQIVPNKPEYIKNPPFKSDHTKSPTLFFVSSDNSLDRETLFETLYFAFLFRASVKYDWSPHGGIGLYFNNYSELVQDVKKNPKLLDEFYVIKMENQSLTDITDSVRKQLDKELSTIK